jgi:hypothetical protein
MSQRSRLAFLTLGLTMTVGCGLIQSGMSTSQTHRPGAVSRTFDVPVARMMMTILELDWDEIQPEKEFDFPLQSGPNLDGSQMKAVDGKFTIDPETLRLEPMKINGKTKDERPVTVWLQPKDQDKKVEVTILIGRFGDAELSNAYLDRLADRLIHPILRTPEEKAKRMIVVPIDGTPVTPVRNPVSLPPLPDK